MKKIQNNILILSDIRSALNVGAIFRTADAVGIDKIFLTIVLILILGGLAMFVSASLGILARNEAMFFSVIRSQLIFGLGCGLIAMYLALKISYKTWSK